MQDAGTVMLVTAEGAAAASLEAAAMLLEEFGVPWRRFDPRADQAGRFGTGSGGSVKSEWVTNWRAIIVASPDANEPCALAAASRLPVLRVPSGDGSQPVLALLQAADGNLPGPSGNAPFATMAAGEAGAKNAALFVVSLLALTDDRLHAAWAAFRARQTEAVLAHPPLT